MAAYYRSILRDFLVDDPKFVLGQIASKVSHNELQRRQIKAWEREIEILQSCFGALLTRLASAETWSLLLEYPIPRRRKRLDAVLIAGDVIICVEFKTEDKAHSLASQRQAEDYALDLRDFHEISRDRKLVPLVVVPKAPPAAIRDASLPYDSVRPVRLANKNDLVDVILEIFQAEHTAGNSPIDPEAWDRSPYRPVPTIIEAAEALFAGHNVREIAHSDLFCNGRAGCGQNPRRVERCSQSNAQNRWTTCRCVSLWQWTPCEDCISGCGTGSPKPVNNWGRRENCGSFHSECARVRARST